VQILSANTSAREGVLKSLGYSRWRHSDSVTGCDVLNQTLILQLSVRSLELQLFWTYFEESESVPNSVRLRYYERPSLAGWIFLLYITTRMNIRLNEEAYRVFGYSYYVEYERSKKIPQPLRGRTLYLYVAGTGQTLASYMGVSISLFRIGSVTTPLLCRPL
jgi:hypothetical protein